MYGQSVKYAICKYFVFFLHDYGIKLFDKVWSSIIIIQSFMDLECLYYLSKHFKIAVITKQSDFFNECVNNLDKLHSYQNCKNYKTIVWRLCSQNDIFGYHS